ncbi:MAG TPA: hypothetical protein VGC27_00820, partial [Rhizomicrobium sp.]
GALTAGVSSVALSYLYANKWPYIPAFDSLGHIPFMNRMGYVFLICLGLAVIVSLMQKPKPQTMTVELADIDYSTSKSFVIASFAVIAVLIALYATWW